ncbi:hypothetical protein CI109_104451 [Kwoniella shandongensis]|uniref:Major facilitator superfamily (MFS) profile domain-containing protein n=1 Tax=Kwoniella shandongensis TaxID=1734106 RepID=A0AAJ8LIL9_9TREE
MSATPGYAAEAGQALPVLEVDRRLEQETHVEPARSSKGRWQKFVSWIWDADFYEKSDAERALVFKLDCFMLASLTIGWWIKNLDQSNLSNAYISGMKEDLNINGNQYTYMLSIYAAVVAAMQVPSNFIVMKIRPRYLLAASEILWGIFTFAQAGAHSYQAMYGFRFCVALFESMYYPVAFFLLGSWYTKPELGKRISLWFIAGPAGSAFSGYMQAGIYKGLNGTAGLAGWRWLYTLPLGFLTFFLLPDFPENTQTWWLTQEQKELARERMTRSGAAKVTSKINWKVVRDTMKNWKFWTLVPWYTFYSLEAVTGRQFGIYLKAFKYSVSDRNNLPATSSVITIVSLIIFSYISDRTVKYGRGWFIGLVLFWAILPNAVLAFWTNSNSLRVAAFLANGTTYVTPIFFAWIADICSTGYMDPSQRAFITGATTCLWYTTDAWLPTIIFKQTDGPRFKKGFITSWIAGIIAFLLVPLIHILQQRDGRRAAIKAEEESREVASARSYEDVDNKE